MSCSNPMIAVNTGIVNPATGKVKYRFLKSVKNFARASADQLSSDMRNFGEYIFEYELDEVRYSRVVGEDGLLRTVTTPKYLVDESTGEVLNRAVILPCGQCLECRTRYAAQWADRIILEARYHDQSFFITLTYDGESIPFVEDSNGNINFSLLPKDLQDFIKRLRRQQEYYHGNKIRFYAVGEYGHLHHRPHYHIIVFGLILDDLKYFRKSKLGTPLHTSQTISDLWDRGDVEVEPLTWETACYTARYTVKKLGKSETDFYENLGIVPEFTRMSLKPAIGARYLEDNMERIYKSDEILIPTTESVRHIKPPHYYDEKYDLLFPEQMANVKENRKNVAKKLLKLKFDRFSGSYLELLENEHLKFINNKPNVKRRNLE